MISYWILWRKPSADAVKDEDGFYRLHAIAWLRPEWFFLYFLLLLTACGNSWIIAGTLFLAVLMACHRLNEWIRRPPQVAIDRPFVEYGELFTVRIKLTALPRRPLNVKIGAVTHRIEYPEITNFIYAEIPLTARKKRWNTWRITVNGWWFKLPLIDGKTAKNNIEFIKAKIETIPHES